MAYWIIRQKAINVFVPGALSCNDPLRKTLSRVKRVGSDNFGDPFIFSSLTKLDILLIRDIVVES